jgi:TatD DNase family protein
VSAGVDAHCHLDRIDAPLADVIARARAVGVGGAVIAAADPADQSRLRRIARETGCAWVVGVHPWWAQDADALDHVRALAGMQHAHGIGECGLDFRRAGTEAARERQRVVLRPQLALAAERRLPVVLHCVRAWQVLRDELAGFDLAGGMVHGWSGGPEQTRSVLSAGLHVSVGPDVLRSAKARAGAGSVPLDRLLVESDAPDRPVAGAAHGEPAHAALVARALAEDRSMTTEQLLAVTGANARRLLRYSSRWASS